MCMWKTFTLPLSVCETVTKVRRAAIVKWTTMSGFLGDYRGARAQGWPGTRRRSCKTLEPDALGRAQHHPDIIRSAAAHRLAAGLSEM